MLVRQYNIKAERSQSCTMSIRDLGILLRATYLTFARRRVTVRRVLFVLFAVSLYLCFRVVVRLGHAADDLFFRRYQQQTVHAPLYIVTFPRSGTTFLHRLIVPGRGSVHVHEDLSDALSICVRLQAGRLFFDD